MSTYDVEKIKRRKTREVAVGSCVIGGDNPVRVQSMTTTDTRDVAKTLAEIHRAIEAGCELIRVAVPDKEALSKLSEIKAGCRIPLVADIHFKYEYALGAIDAGVDKVRINPGNVGGMKRFKEVVRKCRDRGIPMRIGVNSGSLEKDLLEKYGYPCPEAFVESAIRHIEACEEENYRDVIISLKSSDLYDMVETYRRFSKVCDYPLHLGVTEAGMPGYGTIKSAIGIGTLLLEGIGDTIRISLVGDPAVEVKAAYDILKATRRRILAPEVVACPTCGRIEIDLEKIVGEVEKRLKGNTKPLRISILGCVVNGPGEALESDIGIAAGRGMGMIFKKGKMLRKVKEAEMVDALVEEIEKM